MANFTSFVCHFFSIVVSRMQQLEKTEKTDVNFSSLVSQFEAEEWKQGRK